MKFRSGIYCIHLRNSDYTIGNGKYTVWSVIIYNFKTSNFGVSNEVLLRTKSLQIFDQMFQQSRISQFEIDMYLRKTYNFYALMY